MICGKCRFGLSSTLKTLCPVVSFVTISIWQRIFSKSSGNLLESFREILSKALLPFAPDFASKQIHLLPKFNFLPIQNASPSGSVFNYY